MIVRPEVLIVRFKVGCSRTDSILTRIQFWIMVSSRLFLHNPHKVSWGLRFYDCLRGRFNVSTKDISKLFPPLAAEYVIDKIEYDE